MNKPKLLKKAEIGETPATSGAINTENRSILKLKNITISGYKSISSKFPLSIELGDITVLLGANGSGKSNIVSFFKMLNFMMTGSFQPFIETAGTSQVFLHYGSKETALIKGKLHFESNTQTDNYNFHLGHASPDRLIITHEEIIWGNKDSIPQHRVLTAEFKESALVNSISLDNTSKIVRNILQNCKVYQFHDSSSSSPMRQSTPLNTSNYLQSEGNNLASFLYLLKKSYPSNYKQIVSYVRMIMPQFKDFYLEPNPQKYILLNWEDTSANDYIFTPEQLSDGSLRFIALATLLLQPKKTIPKVIIIDEPELGLHPFAVNQLGEMVKEAAKNTQIIIATQSPSLVDEFELEDIIVINRDDKNGCSTAQKLAEEDLKDWLENYTISELWNKNIIGGRP